jgi:hypothetical protein
MGAFTRTFTNYPLRRRAGLAARRAASRTLSFLGLKHPWVLRRNPPSPEVLDEFKLFAIVGTWMEADVIEATVRNAFTQGCERVFLVDNDSPDDTVERAIAAGAELAQSFTTSRFDIDFAYELMNECVASISVAEGAEHIWWLWVDADEFPHGARGLTVRDYLATLDRSFRVVGARYINHYPGDEPYYMPRFHPLDFQPLGEELTTRTCWSWHRKHPLQRFDRNQPTIKCDIGIHRCFSSERPLFEPAEPVFLHHFPFRDRETTRRRLRSLFAPVEGTTARAHSETSGAEHMAARLRCLEAVYAHDWQEVPLELVPGCRRPAKEPTIWTELVSPEDVHVERWYRDQRTGGTQERVPLEVV